MRDRQLTPPRKRHLHCAVNPRLLMDNAATSFPWGKVVESDQERTVGCVVCQEEQPVANVVHLHDVITGSHLLHQKLRLLVR